MMSEQNKLARPDMGALIIRLGFVCRAHLRVLLGLYKGFGDIGALIIRIGFWAYCTILIKRPPPEKIVLVIIYASVPYRIYLASMLPGSSKPATIT